MLHFWRDRNRLKEAHTVLLHKAEERCWFDHMYLFLSLQYCRSRFEPQLGYVQALIADDVHFALIPRLHTDCGKAIHLHHIPCPPSCTLVFPCVSRGVAVVPKALSPRNSGKCNSICNDPPEETSQSSSWYHFAKAVYSIGLSMHHLRDS
jgi:hypothetical protein